MTAWRSGALCVFPTFMTFPTFMAWFLVVGPTLAAEPLSERIDRHIENQARLAAQPLSPVSSDAEFVRRVTLDFAGRIPTTVEVRAFLADTAADKRERLITQLIDGPEFAPHFANQLHIALMERLGDNPHWTAYLTRSLAANRPWDQMVRDMLWPDPANSKSTGAAFFLAKRLENFGQNPVDYSGLTRDVGRLFLGKNLGCAECHDHLFIEDYKQAHFQGLHAFLKNSYLVSINPPEVGERPTTEKTTFASVFTKVEMMTAPALPEGEMVMIPTYKKGEEYLVAPDKKTKKPGILKFSPLKTLSEQLPAATNTAFVQTSANRFWFLLMGRGLIHPLDLSHGRNPPSHPQLLVEIADHFADHQFDIKDLLKQIARSKAYQRTSQLPAGVTAADPRLFSTALERRLSAEQLAASLLTATGTKSSEAMVKKFVKAYANQPREPEEEFTPSLQGSLFILHDPVVLELLQPVPGNLVDRTSRLSDSRLIADELYLSILSRPAAVEEIQTVTAVLAKRPNARSATIANLAWSLLASVEFIVNH